jgi:hypothetical protein
MTDLFIATETSEALESITCATTKSEANHVLSYEFAH